MNNIQNPLILIDPAPTQEEGAAADHHPNDQVSALAQNALKHDPNLPAHPLIERQVHPVKEPNKAFLEKVCRRLGMEMPEDLMANPSKRADLARCYAEKDLEDTAKNIKKFAIEDQKALIEIATLGAEQLRGNFGLYIKDFGIESEKERFLLARINFQYPLYAMQDIENFDICDQDALIQLAGYCINIMGAQTAQHIQNFKITDQEALINLARRCMRFDPDTTAQYLHCFGIKDQDALASLFVSCLEHNFGNIQWHDTIFPEIAKTAPLDEIVPLDLENHESATRALLAFVKDRLPGCDFGWALRYLQGIDNTIVHKQTCWAMAATCLLLRLRVPKEKWPEASKLLPEVFELKSPNLYFPLASEIGRFYENNHGEIPVALHSPAGPLIGALLADIPSALPGKLPKKLLKDAKKLKSLIFFLLALKNQEGLSLPEKQKVLNLLAASGDFFGDLKQMHLICRLKAVSLLKDLEKDNLQALVKQAFDDNFSLGEVADAAEQIDKTFGKCRNPDAIWDYFASVRIGAPEACEAFRGFVASVCDGSFLAQRYNLARSEHLQKLGKEVVDEWQQGLCLPLDEQDGPVPEAFDPSKWLLEKSNRFDLDSLPSLKKYLETEDPRERQNIYDAFMAQARAEGKAKSSRTAFEQACLLFAKTGSDDALRTMERTLLSYNKDSPFIQDVRGQVEEQRLEKKQARPTLIDTDDPYHLLLCGTDIAGSCQHVAGDPKYNRGLVGYLLHGQIRLVAVVNDKGHIVARSLLRILWDGEKPVLFLERLYGDAQYQGAIEAMAKKKAEKMNLLLTGIDKEGLSEYEKPLKSLGGPAPYEYCDARGQGICLNGAFTIHRARVIFTPPDRAVEIRNI